MVRSKVGWLLTLSALGWILGPVGQASGLATPSPSSICTSASRADQTALEASLYPADGATVQAGTPVTFSGNSASPVTFAVASSSALLSSPDLDSGLASVQPEPASSGPPLNTFASTKATAAPGNIYWAASFSSAGLAECAGQPPATYTTHARTLTVAAPTAEGGAVKQASEEGAAKQAPEEEAAATDGVSLDRGTINIQGDHEAAVKLACTGTQTCSGRLILTARLTKGDKPRKGEQASSSKTTIGSSRFSIPAGKTTLVKLALNATGRTLLEADHGRLSADLTILESSPASSQTHTETVQLVQQRAAKGKKP